MIVYLASNNAHKGDEIRDLIGPDGPIELRSAREIGGMPDVDESAKTFEGNARLKAEALAARLPNNDCWVLADDSGLEVDALGGAPGVESARYAGEHGNDAANNRKLLNALATLPADQRTARFRCVLVLLKQSGDSITAEGSCEGRIAGEERGKSGFGYDPIFIPVGYEETLGELGPMVKSTLSHRAAAVRKLVAQARPR